MTTNFLDLVHVDPAGNQLKAGLVAEALAAWLESLSPDGLKPPARRD